METLYSSEELRAKLGQAACKRSEDFSSAAMAKNYMKVYRC